MAIDALPKAELHLHLEGSIRPETALKLAARHGVTLTPEEVAARYNFSNFNGFLETFKWVTSYLRTPDDYALITRQLCEELVRQNVVYAELTDFRGRDFAPHAKSGSHSHGHSRCRAVRAVCSPAHRFYSGCGAAVRPRSGEGSRALGVQAADIGSRRVWHGRRRAGLSHSQFSPRV